MATDRSEYQISIKTGLDDAGLKGAKAQVEDLTDSLHETGKTAEDAHGKVSEGAHKSELSHHELKEAVHAVAQQFGGLADVGLWLNPMTAALAATLFLIDKIKERLNEAKEAVRQLAEQTDIRETGTFQPLRGIADTSFKRP